MTLTTTEYETLRRPFTPQAVKFRLDAKEAFNGKARCVVYIDASLAADRIALVDLNWHAEYTRLGPAADSSPMLCRLTVNGLTREQTGQYATATADGKHVKSATSDAFKRAAAEFGVGVYLRNMPALFATEAGCWKKGAKLGGLNDLGLKTLREAYAKAIADMALASRFGQPIDHGDVVIGSPPIETEAMQEAADAEGLTDVQAAILESIALKCGYSFDRADRLAEDYEVHLASFLDYAETRGPKLGAERTAQIRAAAIELDLTAVVTSLDEQAAAA